jgi:hypothetical protein
MICQSAFHRLHICGIGSMFLSLLYFLKIDRPMSNSLGKIVGYDGFFSRRDIMSDCLALRDVRSSWNSMIIPITLL